QQGARLDMYKLSFRRRTLISPSRSLLLAGSLCLLSLGSTALAHEAKKAPVAETKAEAPQTTTVAKPTTATDSEKAEETTEGDDASEVSAAPAAPTDVEIEEARVSFEAGTKAFDEGKFDEAQANFEKAHKTIPSPHAEYWLAVSMDKADPEGKNVAEVVVAYTTFLSNSGKSHVGADKVSAAEARMKELKKLLPAKMIFITTPDGATLTIDGKRQEGVTPLEVELTSGPHTVEATLEGHESSSIELNAEGGTSVEQQITLAAIPAPAVEPAPALAEEERVQSAIVPAAVTLGLAGAGLITGTIFGIMALISKSKFNDNPNTADADAAERNSLIADMSVG